MENSRNWKYWMGHKEWFLHRQLKNIEMQEIALTAKKAAIKLAVSAIEKEAAGLHFTKDELGWIKSYMTHAYKTTDSFEGDHDGTNCFNISVKAGLMAANFDVDDWEGEE